MIEGPTRRQAGAWLIAAMGLGRARAQTLDRDGVLDFNVLRHGLTIGQHRIELRRDGERVEVAIRARVAVRLMFITVYRFELDASETWRSGRFVALRSRTHDDGADHAVMARAIDSGEVEVIGDGKHQMFAPGTIPITFWNMAIVEGAPGFNPLTGEPVRYGVRDSGADRVTAGGSALSARRYVTSGELDRELWYDEERRLVRMALTGADGSRIDYLLR